MKFNTDFYKYVSLSPFKYLKPSVRTESYMILFALLLQVAMLFITKSYSALLVVFSSVFASCVVEVIHLKFVRKNLFTWCVALIRGILIGLLIPQSYPPLTVFVISFSVLMINVFILGGFANSWINPVCAAVAVCWILGMNFFPEVGITFETLQVKNPALVLIQNGVFPVADFDPKITNFLNNKVFNFLGVSIPDGYVSLFWDSHSVIPAFRFNFLTIITSLILFSFDVYGFLIPAAFTFTYGLFVKAVTPFFFDGPLFSGDLLLAFLTSGILFCNLFLIQWHGTVPFTNRGKLLYGVFAGFLAFFIVGCGTSPVGTVFTILIINLISLLIQSVENRYHRNFEATVLSKRMKNVEEGIDA